MDEQDLAEANSLGGFWDQFEETPENLDEFETSYTVISTNEELGLMEIVLVTMEKNL